jgi:hypothetical protein
MIEVKPESGYAYRARRKPGNGTIAHYLELTRFRETVQRHTYRVHITTGKPDSYPTRGHAIRVYSVCGRAETALYIKETNKLTAEPDIVVYCLRL